MAVPDIAYHLSRFPLRYARRRRGCGAAPASTIPEAPKYEREPMRAGLRALRTLRVRLTALAGIPSSVVLLPRDTALHQSARILRDAIQQMLRARPGKPGRRH